MLRVLIRKLLGFDTAKRSSSNNSNNNKNYSNSNIPHAERVRKKLQSRQRQARSKTKLVNHKNINSVTTVHDYKIKNDGTALDTFIKKLLIKINFPINGVSVSGLTGKPTKQNHQAFKEMREKPPFSCLNKKEYFVRLRLSYDSADKWGISQLFPENIWAEGFDLSKQKKLFKEASQKVKIDFADILESSDVRAGVAYSRGKEQYISFGVELPVTLHDILTHCPNNFTDYGNAHLSEISNSMQGMIKEKDIDLLSLYHDRSALNKLCRAAENDHRKANGIAEVGETPWVAQDALYTCIKKYFPRAISEYSPKWLGSQRIDIFIPKHRIAIEYQGKQHYSAIEFFGGEDAFQKVRERDRRKAKLCSENNVLLLEWPYTRPINENEIKKLISHIDLHLKS